MYKIEISFKSHQLLPLKRGLKSLQHLIKGAAHHRCATMQGFNVETFCIWSGNPFSSPKQSVKEDGEFSFFQLTNSIPLPRVRKKWTVLRSPHIDKKSREQFEWTRWKERRDIFSTQRRAILYALSLIKHSETPGVELHLRLHSLTFFKRMETSLSAKRLHME
jgi:small subunit ribosomal protein S10